MTKHLALFGLLALTACGGPAERTEKSSNNSFKVERLFETDGCRVYRFWDAGYYRYFSSCSGNVSWTENCGKSCTHPVDVPTVRQP